MKTVKVNDAKASIAELLKMIAKGNEVVITSNGKDLAKVIPMTHKKKTRTLGLNKGQMKMSKDFAKPLPDKFWEG